MSDYHHGNLREALILRAIDVIGAKGVEGLSLRQIAKDLGVSHAAPARHFTSKADLLSEIVRGAYLELTADVLRAAEDAENQDAVMRLNFMAQSTIRWAVKNRAKFSVMTNPDVSRFADKALKASLKEFTQVVSTALDDAQKAGFRKNVSARVLLHYAVGAALGVSMIITDDLMQSVTGVEDSDEIVAAIASQIVPIDNS